MGGNVLTVKLSLIFLLKHTARIICASGVHRMSDLQHDNMFSCTCWVFIHTCICVHIYLVRPSGKNLNKLSPEGGGWEDNPVCGCSGCLFIHQRLNFRVDYSYWISKEKVAPVCQEVDWGFFSCLGPEPVAVRIQAMQQCLFLQPEA